jgi:hypothetical protein
MRPTSRGYPEPHIVEWQHPAKECTIIKIPAFNCSVRLPDNQWVRANHAKRRLFIEELRRNFYRISERV